MRGFSQLARRTGWLNVGWVTTLFAGLVLQSGCSLNTRGGGEHSKNGEPTERPIDYVLMAGIGYQLDPDKMGRLTRALELHRDDINYSASTAVGSVFGLQGMPRFAPSDTNLKGEAPHSLTPLILNYSEDGQKDALRKQKNGYWTSSIDRYHETAKLVFGQKWTKAIPKASSAGRPAGFGERAQVPRVAVIVESEFANYFLERGLSAVEQGQIEMPLFVAFDPLFYKVPSQKLLKHLPKTRGLFFWTQTEGNSVRNLVCREDDLVSEMEPVPGFAKEYTLDVGAQTIPGGQNVRIADKPLAWQTMKAAGSLIQVAAASFGAQPDRKLEEFDFKPYAPSADEVLQRVSANTLRSRVSPKSSGSASVQVVGDTVKELAEPVFASGYEVALARVARRETQDQSSDVVFANVPIAAETKTIYFSALEWQLNQDAFGGVAKLSQGLISENLRGFLNRVYPEDMTFDGPRMLELSLAPVRIEKEAAGSSKRLAYVRPYILRFLLAALSTEPGRYATKKSLKDLFGTELSALSDLNLGAPDDPAVGHWIVYPETRYRLGVTYRLAARTLVAMLYAERFTEQQRGTLRTLIDLCKTLFHHNETPSTGEFEEALYVFDRLYYTAGLDESLELLGKSAASLPDNMQFNAFIYERLFPALEPVYRFDPSNPALPQMWYESSPP